jgi:hypothetical protein
MTGGNQVMTMRSSDRPRMPLQRSRSGKTAAAVTFPTRREPLFVALERRFALLAVLLTG